MGGWREGEGARERKGGAGERKGGEERRRGGACALVRKEGGGENIFLSDYCLVSYSWFRYANTTV